MPPSSPRFPPSDPRDLEGRIKFLERRVTDEAKRREDLELRLDDAQTQVQKLRGSLSDVPEHLRRLQDAIGQPPHLGQPGTGLTGYVMGIAERRDSQIEALLSERDRQARALAEAAEKARAEEKAEADFKRRLFWDRVERLAKFLGAVTASVAVIEALRRLLGG